MPDFFDSETMWLNITNAVLGLVTLVCLGAFCYGVVREIAARVAKRARVPLETDTHAFALEDLGITMADGGVRIDETSNPDLNMSDPPNIFRSNN